MKMKEFRAQVIRILMRGFLEVKYRFFGVFDLGTQG